MVRIISALILAVTAVCASAADPLQLVDNPPDRHVVVKGDTLWGISGKFLKQPWRWPEIWQMNKEQIKDPHWIYPGDVVMLDMSSGSPRLRLGKKVRGTSTGTGKLQPTVYSTPIEQVIPSIPPGAIEPFISQPLIIEGSELNTGVKIVAMQEDRMLVGTGDSFYASGIPDASVEKWNIFRKGKPLTDPDTGKTIAYEAFFLGNARLLKPGEPALLRISLAKEEIARGDRLIAAPEPQIISYVPHRPEQPVAAKVLGIYGGLREGGANSVVALNAGKNNGMEIGHVVALYRKRVSVDVEQSGRRIETPVPEERYGLAFVFRVFNGICYALVVESSKSVIVGDSARNP
ncbi:LysM peptidoglycan-binding domain-containing protein [Dechloromonas sp. XY25]|uniref:LysM peptidoglycan-binding domain-containing protein n=1 Tax=Dechloromonas hankyongensis TaxID=2908002 RepID=A0ABS9JY46_9RHOO|nr:LysM peptidoglycan-binding domain-containing protein [Dechloromonas hankyongensis]MCG2575833.1 LysM peptidoglycan-binding domain-containing protein [Dechloromonas hankyongensis]